MLRLRKYLLKIVATVADLRSAGLISGALAQLGEHYTCNVGVMGSTPIRSTGLGL